MFQHEADEAGRVIDTVAEVNFRRKGSGYWYPDKILDRNVLCLLGIDYKVTKDADEVLRQLEGKAWAVWQGHNIRSDD